ncbi:ATP-binding protein [Spiribacter halobius]|nr:AAA family ATPase [Spiribacter halobius]UEX79288.1 AAA family ATPase [Spiribacter halobius]
MATLELRFLGDVAVLHDGTPLALPPSRKTRALLAYLALQPRRFRREHLCELLWEVPDDPRGALRWSLSKLRRLVDEPGRPRIQADRLGVRFDPAGVRIDVTELHELIAAGPDTASVETLESAATRLGGHFLEGLELTELHAFHAWCVAERERTTLAQATLLQALVQRLEGEPARALPYAQALTGLLPYDENLRAALIRLLVAAGHAEEAEQQYRLGRRLLAEIGAPPSERLYHAWRGPPGAAARPVPRAPAPPAPPRVAGALVGREAELATLRQAATAAAGGRAQVVLLCGEPGIGKSRLLAEGGALAREAGARVLSAAAFEAEALRPYALWLDALRAEDCALAEAVFGEEAARERQRLFAGLADLVARETAARPLALLFDDLQWCDESSAAALHYVARMSRGCSLLAVLAGRADELRDNAAVQRALRGLRREGLLTELRLGPLPKPALQALIHAHAPTADSGRLGHQCRGNPLLAIELARAEAAGGRVAESLEELVAERAARLDVEAGEVLQWAAVLAPRISLGALADLTRMDGDRVGVALEAAEAQALLETTEHGPHFPHELIARAVYQRIPPARRRVMHRRVAERLAAGEAPDRELAADLAHHAALGGDPALAARGMVAAGRLCLRFFANEDAASLARSGLQWVTALPEAERVGLELELRDILYSAVPITDWERAAAECVALAERALDHGAAAHARLGYHMASYLRWAHGQWSGAREESLQAERVTRGAGEAEQIAGMAEAARCLAMLERDLGRAEALALEAQALASRRGIPHHAIPAALGMLRFHENRLDEAEERLQEARALSKAAGDRMSEFQANEYLVMIDFERGRLEDACRRCTELVAIGERLREGSEAPYARVLQGLCRYAREDDPGELDRALPALREADARHRLACALSRAALLDLERGRPERARERAHEALEHAEALERATETLLARLALAGACEALGDAAGYARQQAAIERLADAPAAAWARARAAARRAAEA